MSDHPFHKIDTGKVDSNGNPIKWGTGFCTTKRINTILVSRKTFRKGC